MKFASIHGKISYMAGLHPEQIALESGTRKISYKNLEQTANRLAIWMQQQHQAGAGQNDSKVILFMEKSPELVLAILAALKSGTIFIPLDPNYPKQRLAVMVEELGASAVLLFERHQEKWMEIWEMALKDVDGVSESDKTKDGRIGSISTPPVLALDGWFESALDKNGSQGQDWTGEDLELMGQDQIQNPHAYIYFTSGSTGRPKGILGRHQSLFHFIAWESGEFKIDPSYRFGQFTSPSFDPYLRDILVPLVSGATICIPEDQDLLMQPGRWVEWIDRKQIHFFHMTPSLFKTLMAQVEDENDLISVRVIMLAGEMLRGNDLVKFFRLFGERMMLGNLYGPTETTLAKFFYRVQPEDQKRVNVPVGKAIPGAQVLILNDQQERCRVGQIGEVYIRTPFISAGYYQRPELTREVFLPNPFGNHAKDVIYKTGDLGRLLPTGDLELIGRKDQQVKVRGVRIEPGEIEQHLLGYAGVQEAVVVARENDQGETYLAGYLVTDPSQTLVTREIRSYLAQLVPEFMLPDYFVQLAEMPLNPNGKIDRKALPDPVQVVQEQDYLPPKGEVEERLALIWQEILRVEQVGRDAHFFELGGHSLRAATLLARIYQEFQVELALRDLFVSPIFSKQAQLIQAAGGGLISNKMSDGLEKMTIPRVKEQEFYSLSSGQRRLFLLHELDEVQTSYHIPNAVLIQGQLLIPKLEEAFRRLIERHEVLRSSFHLVEGQPMQKVHPQVEFALEYEQIGIGQRELGEKIHLLLEGLTLEEGDVGEPVEWLQELVQGFVRPFDLSQPPLLRAKVWQIGVEDYLCMFDYHHIVADGTSTGILIRELLALYEGKELDELPVRYRDYALWEEKHLGSEEFQRQEEYWLEQFAGTIPLLNLPTDFPRPAVQRYVGAKLSLSVEQELVAKLEELAKAEGVTMYMIFLAAYGILLAEYTGQQDLVVGTPLAGRNHADLQNLLGMFIHTLALRVRLDGDWTIGQVLDQVKELTLEAFAHQEYPFETLVERLELRRDLSRNPVFDTMLIFQNMEIPKLEGQDLTIQGLAFDHAVSKMDLSLIVQPRTQGLELIFEYSTDLFLRETIDQLAQHFLHLLEEMAGERERLWMEVGLLSATEQREMIAKLNQTEFELTESGLVHQLIARQAEERPDQVALVCGRESLTYAQLNQQANRLAKRLRQSGVGPETVVGVLVDRSVGLLIALLGVLKAGGAYLPLDPAYPKERLQELLADSEAALLLTSSGEWSEGLIFEGEILKLANLIGDEPLSELDVDCRPDHMAYLIYTSGSTGRPKGVMVEHRSLQNFIAGMGREIGMDAGQTILSLTTVSFDIFFLETLLPLTQGMRVILGTVEEQQMVEAFRQALVQHQVNLLQITPSRMQLFLQGGVELSELSQLDVLMLGGEPLPYSLLEQVRVWRPKRILNLYGPTETTIWSTVADLTEATEVTIGRPIINTQIAVINQRGQMVPPRVAGELLIGGAGLARGYFQRSELTQERFVVYPSVTGERFYRTGDLARWRGDGQLEFLGRMDQQLKIRGYRIEPGEIEARLRQLPGVQDAVVLARNDHQGIGVLCAYLVLDESDELAEKFSSQTVRQQLMKVLPEYMVPTYLIPLKALPLTPNGKIDRQGLPDPLEIEDAQAGERRIVLPGNPVEEQLAKIWAEILGHELEELSVDDHFFDLGGHSLKAVQVVTRVRQKFALDLGMMDLFKNPTIAQLAERIGELDGVYDQLIPVLAQQPEYPLSYAQQRLWVLEQKNIQTSAYNLSATYLHNGQLVKEDLEQACHLLIQRHESLRTSFTMGQEEPVQRIWPEVEFDVRVYDLRLLTEPQEQQAQLEKIQREAIGTPFDLEQAPLFRVSLIRESGGQDRVLFVMHHLISDGWSMDIFQEEMKGLYGAVQAGNEAELPPLRVQYRDFAHWQREQLASHTMDQHRQFWQQQLGDQIAPLQLPTDYPYQSLFQDRQGARYGFQIATETLNGLQQIAREAEASLFMVLLAGFMTLLAQLTDQNEVMVSTPVAGREHEDLQGLIGFFLNTLILKGQVRPEWEFDRILAQVRENTLQALEYQGYPFELMAEELGLEQDVHGPSVTSIFFNMLNFAQSGQGIMERKPSEHRLLGPRMKFDLGCYLQEYADGLEIECHYRTGLFKPHTVTYIMGEYQRLLVEIGKHPHQRVAELNLFSVDRLREGSSRQFSFEIDDISGVDNLLAHTAAGATLVTAFEAQVELHPDKMAVKGAKGEYTYRELNEVANEITYALLDLYAGDDNLPEDEQRNELATDSILKGRAKQTQIALLFEHDLDLVAGIMGVLKAGDLYVPLDPTYPEQRLAEIMVDAGVTSIVTNDENLLLAKNLIKESCLQKITIVNLTHLQRSKVGRRENPQVEIQPDQLAYLLYTSGSTGKPKGVMQNHRNVLHFIKTYTRRLQITPKDRLTLFSSYGFDAAVMDLYGAILNGATLYIYDVKADGKLAQLGQWLQEEEITIYHSIPTLFRYFADTLTEERFPALRLLVMGGEPLTKADFELYRTYFGAHTRMINGLGPTESTVTLQYWMDQKTEMTHSAIPVGEPVEETEVLIWTEAGQEARVYQVGELIFKSPYLALGYWQRPAETEQAFGVDPRTGEGRVYRSGDLGIRLPDGTIQFVGRKDFQVKVRGYRIETAEIEQALEQIPAIRQSVVVLRPEGEGRLIAYYRFKAGAEQSSREIKQILSSSLPSYMVPTDYVSVDQFPLTATGKIDRRALLDNIGVEREVEDYQPPLTEWENRLAQLWTEVLGVEQIDRRDDFFALGGHSLKAIALVARIHRHLAVEMPLHQIFVNPDLIKMAALIQEKAGDQVSQVQFIPRVAEADYYPVSSAQKRMFILYQMDPAGLQYNMPRAKLIQGQLDRVRLEGAFQKLIQRHESLRTSFHLLEGEPVQKVHAEVEFQIQQVQLAKEDVDGWLEEWVSPFDLSQAPLIRVALVELAEESHLLVYDLHHIISDGVSQVVLMNDFVRFYQGIGLPELRLQYKDVAQWQNQFLHSEEQQTLERYWLERFAQLPPMLELPTDSPRPALQSDAGDWYRILVDQVLTQKLYDLAKSQGATLYMVLLAGYHLLLTRYSGEGDTVVGLPIAGRSKSPELEELIGVFVNILPMRNYAEAGLTFTAFLQQVKENALDAYAYQDYPFEMLVERLNLERNLSRHPLFDTVLVLQNMEQKEMSIPGLEFQHYEVDTQMAKFDLTLNVIEQDGELLMTFYYCSDLFKEETIGRMGEHLLNLFREITEDPEEQLDRLKLLSAVEERKLLEEWEPQAVEYPKEKTIHQLFAEQVVARSGQVALTFGEQEMTYGELDRRANQVAWYLQGLGVGPDQIVGLLLERSIEMIIGILAVLKAGGAYLPLDPSYPMERLQYTLEDSGTELLLTTADVMAILPDLTFQGQMVDLNAVKMDQYSVTAPEVVNTPDHLAYIIYTSGSTGRPKGVMIEHRNVVRLLFNEEFQFDFTAQDVWTLFHSYCFDFSVWEMYGALLYGGRLVMVPKLTAQDSEAFLQMLEDERVTVLNQTPTAFTKLVQEMERKREKPALELRYVIFGGEALKPLLLRPWKEQYPETKLINMYGITETTVHVTYKEITQVEMVSNVSNIGRPIPTLSTYLMDEQLRLVPVGVVGEICVGGAGVARGYLNRPELTAERFVINPYRPFERLYRSGDLARMLSNGELEYLGRKDRQVKIRGFRIELGEIEGMLLKHPLIQDVVLIDRMNLGDVYLVAYLVAVDGDGERTEEVTMQKLTVSKLRDYLAQELPDYMIPAYFIYIDEIPLTSNGKVDRRALPEPDLKGIVTGHEYVPPTNPVESRLVEIWSEILLVEGMGVTDNFFELGGHSLNATVLVARIVKEWQVELPLKEVFAHPTIRELAGLILTSQKTGYHEILPVGEQEYYPVSSAQKRLLVLQQMIGATTSYNLPGVLQVQGDLDRERLEQVIGQLIQRHEALRTYFDWVDGEPVQRVLPEVEFALATFEKEIRSERVEQVIADFVRPFDLSLAPLLRVGIFSMDDATAVLIFDLHHIIADGISLAQLIQEFAHLYDGKELAELNLQYKDFAVWQQGQLKNGVFHDQEAYWLTEFAEPLAPLELATDHPRPEIIDYAGARVHFQIQSELRQGVEKLAQEQGVTMYMLLFACYQVLLSRYGVTEDLAVGTPIAGRSHPDLEQVLGMFVNTLPIRTKPEAYKSFSQYLQEVKEQILRAHAHQDYPFDDLVEKLHHTWDLSRNPIFDTVFVLENQPQNAATTAGLVMEPYPFDHSIAKFDLTWRGFVRAEEIRCHLEYRTSLFEEDTIQQMATDYLKILEQIVANLHLPIGEVEVVGGAQRLDEVDLDDLEFDF